MQRDINFFSVYRSPIDSDSGLDKITLIGLIMIISSIVLVVGLFAYYKTMDLSIIKQSSDINKYLLQSDITAAQSKIIAETGQISVLNQYKIAASSQATAFSSQPQFSDTVLDTISHVMPADVTIQTIDYKGSTITLTCTSKDKFSPAVFVHSLAGVSIFTGVTYTGVDTLAAGSSYSFTVTFTMNGGSGK